MIINNHSFKLQYTDEYSYIAQYLPFLINPLDISSLNIDNEGYLHPYIYNEIPCVIYKGMEYNGIIASATKTVTLTQYLREFGLCFDFESNTLTRDDVFFSSIGNTQYQISRQIPFINMLDNSNRLYIDTIAGEYNVRKNLFKGFITYVQRKSNEQDK